MPPTQTPTPNATSTTEVIINGIVFLTPAPYAKGHQCDEIEASVLNQTLAENLRNNFSKAVKKAKEKAGDRELTEPEVAALQQTFADYCKSYKFALRTGPKIPVDPIGKEALKIATSLVKEALAKKGQKPSDLVDGLFDEHVAKVAAFDNVVTEARRRIEATRAVASEALDI